MTITTSRYGGWTDIGFYLDQDQCDRVNTALKRIKTEPLEVGEISINWREFSRNPDFHESYLDVDDAS